MLAFLALVSGLLPVSRRARAGVVCLAAVGVAYVVSAVFPCDAGCPAEGSLAQTIHNAFGVFEYLGAVAGLLLLARVFRDAAGWRGFAPLCVAAGVLVAGGFAAVSWPGLAAFRGLAQRVAEAGIFLWIAAVSVRLSHGLPLYDGLDEADVRAAVDPRATASVVVAVSRSATHTLAKPNQASILLVAGLGVDGDAHAGATVKHRSRVARDPTRPNLRQVHLIHAELHDTLRAQGFPIASGQMGENVTTRGIDLLALPTGARLRLGARAVVEVTGLRNPCLQLDGIQPGLMAATLGRDAEGKLVRKAGVMAVVVAGGEVEPGDAIRVELPDPPHRALEPV